MHRSPIRSLLFALATVGLLTTTACDSGGDGGKAADTKAKSDDGKADAAEVDDGKADAEPAAETDGAPAGTDEEAEGEDTAAAEDTAGETGGETGEPAADDGGDDGDDDGGDGDDGKTAAAGDGGGDSGGTKKNPPKDPGPKLDGKPIYMKKCKSCHGENGDGDTTIGKKVDIPSLQKTKLGKGKIVSTVTNGVSGTKMKPYKDKLSKDEIDAVAAYVKKL